MLLVVLKAISRLPFSILYRIGDVLSVLLYIIYRRRIVNKNLNIVFPEKTRAEKRRISRKFYRNLMEMSVEILKMLDMKAGEMNERVEFVEDDVYRKIRTTQSPILFYTTHLFNWEWMCAGTQLNVFPSYPVYKPLKNKAFDQYIYTVRSRFGAIPVKKDEIFAVARKLNGLAGIGLLADQSPSERNKGKIWAHFMGEETAFYKGVMVLPYLTQFPCYFAEVYRKERGYYEVKFHEMSSPPYNKSELQIFREYIDLSEKVIRAHPEDWLWTHNRWKYQRKENEEIIIFPS